MGPPDTPGNDRRRGEGRASFETAFGLLRMREVGV